MMLRKDAHQSADGGILVAAILTLAVLATISAVTLRSVSARHQNSYQAAVWREALTAAETGVERAMAELRTAIDDPTHNWAGWTVVDAKGNPTATQKLDRDGRWAAGYIVRATDTLPAQAGEGRQPRYAVMVDVPTTLAASPRRWNQSYRIRSTGISELPGVVRAAADKRDTQLRHVSLVWDRTLGFPTSGSRVDRPQATRTIEVVAQPESVYSRSMIAEINFKLSKKTFIDGYNSNYPETSTNGKYDPAKRTPDGGTILANRWKKQKKPEVIVAEKFDVGHATIYGDLEIQGTLKNVKNYENVKGDKVTNTSYDIPTILPPQWTSVTANISALDGKLPKDLEAIYKIAERLAKAGGPAAQMEAKSATAAAVLAAKGMELPGSADPANPTRYKVEKISVDKKDESIILSNPPGVTESWVEIWVTEDMKINKGGTVFVSNGVHVKIFLDGKKAEIKDTKKDNGGFILESGFAGDLQLIGIEQSQDVKKETDEEFSPKKRSGSIKISDADFTGVINAPDWDVEINPKDSDKDDSISGGQVFGSIVGRKIKVGKDVDYHYDEALAEMGSILGYSFAGWNEVER